jgi:hypothetical protein
MTLSMEGKQLTQQGSSHAAKTVLEDTRRTRRAWQTLEPLDTSILDIRGGSCLTYGISGNIFAHGMANSRGHPSKTRCLKFRQLRHNRDGNSERWHHEIEDLGVDVIDFCFDSSLDLLVLVSQEYVLDHSNVSYH